MSCRKFKGGEGIKKRRFAAKAANGTEEVNEFLARLKHPFKAEVQAIRDIVNGINKNITEKIKWNAPSFSYKGGDIATFNLHAKGRVHLVFHHPAIAKVQSDILEGDYPNRRMVCFADLKDVQVKRKSLETALNQLLRLMDE